jgi:hypothetical protein
MHLGEALTAELGKDEAGDGEGGVDLAGVCKVEAQRRLWQGRKELLELDDCSPSGLALVHILDAQQRAERLPTGRIADRIWVEHDMPTAIEAG